MSIQFADGWRWCPEFDNGKIPRVLMAREDSRSVLWIAQLCVVGYITQTHQTQNLGAVSD